MKLSIAALAVATMASSASAAISGKTASKLLKASRRVEDAQEEAEEEEFSFLNQYTLKLVGCKDGEQIMNAENGEYEYGAAVFRLCPSESGCDSDVTTGCSSNYGDFVVGLGTFVEAYFEDQRDNMQWDDQFEVDRYAQCEEYEVEQNDDQNNNNNGGEEVQYFIGPACTEDGADIRLAVFADEACAYESETEFETISNGWSLPYGTGGLVSTSCIDCYGYNNDEGAYELREMCMELYENTASKCEENMEYFSYYGQDTTGCEYITELLPASASGNGGKIFGWIVFAVLIIGLAGYIVWWRKKKQAAASDLN